MSNALIARQNQIKPFLLNAQKQINSLLGDEQKAKRFLAASLVIASDSSLNRCRPDSIVQALVGIAMADLNVDKNIGHAYLVAYGDSAQLQIGYKGFIQLLYRAGWQVKAFPVYLCDEFSMSFDGWDNKVALNANFDSRDEGDRDWVFHNLRGIYVVSRNVVTKDEYSTFVSKKVIEKLRLFSPNQKDNQYTKPDDKERLSKGLPIGIWANWYVEMAQAKAIKKIAKVLPIGDSRVAMILAADDKTEDGIKVDYIKTADEGMVIDITVNEESDLISSIDAAETVEDLTALLPET
ncbi:recombinase RecT [Methylocucumis oryzae]|uniref:recombinase RecT n=1 Tax=Methylocucumis oryzae TaxID=1632867 RepID=UPI00069896AD|nr:recombinase RecT [Methylocucumis oryzae]